MTDPAPPQPPRHRRELTGWFVCAGIAAIAGVALASIGRGPGSAIERAMAASFTDLVGFYPVLAILWCSIGAGLAFRHVIGRGGPAEPLLLALGLAVVLTLIHLLGVLGWLTPWAAVVMTALSFVVLVVNWWRERTRPTDGAESLGASGWAWMAGVPIAVFAVASASPPGWLWDSEFGAYDALSYHLQLPQEWIREGRIWPADHNVYSYLPGYIESAYVFIANLTFAPVDGISGHGLTAGSAWRAQATHMLGWLFAGSTAWSLGRFTASMLARAGVDSQAARRLGAWCTGALLLATPWVVVVGTIAYNELGVTALGAGAMLAAVDERLRPMWRGLLAGGLVGVACGCKPTAMFFVTPVVGVLLIGTAPRAKWAIIIAGAVVAGALMLAPWMVRNAVASGNPVFPMFTSVFGEGHWTSEQAARYADAHRFDGSIMDRFRLLVWDAPAAAEGARSIERWRGAANPQWGILFPVGIVAGIATLVRTQTRRVGSLLLAGLLLQLIAWMFLTHLQSRFLVPAVLTLCPLVGLGIASIGRVRNGQILCAAIVLAQTAVLVAVFAGQRRGNPNDKLIIRLDADLGRWAELPADQLPPWGWVNRELDPAVRLYVVGDAAVFMYEREVVSNSTYDSWPLGEVMGERPDDPGAWSGMLHERGIDAVLVSLPEIIRLTRSGWIDPRVTLERLARWRDTLGRPAMEWADGSIVLFRIDGEGDE